MADNIIPNENGNGSILALIDDDVEYTDPIRYITDRNIQKLIIKYSQTFKLAHPEFPKEIIEKTAVQNAIEDSENLHKEITETEVPTALIELLNDNKKKDQVSLLRTVQLTPKILLAFIFRAFTEFGFTFSQYKFVIHTKAVDTSALPKFAMVEPETGKVEKIGSTSLSDGQIKQAIKQRKVIVAKFLDNGPNWHCFFLTFESIGGSEAWDGGQPHLHYISNKYEVTREEVLSRFKSGNYIATSVHIPLLDYGNYTK